MDDSNESEIEELKNRSSLRVSLLKNIIKKSEIIQKKKNKIRFYIFHLQLYFRLNNQK